MFEDTEFGHVRVKEINGEPWFVAKDVADIPQISRAVELVRTLEADEVDIMHIPDSLGRKQEDSIINKSGVYSAIMRSMKPEAIRFKNG